MKNRSQFYSDLIEILNDGIDQLESIDMDNPNLTIPVKKHTHGKWIADKSKPTFKPNPKLGEGTVKPKNLQMRQSMLDIVKDFDDEYRTFDTHQTAQKLQLTLRALIDRYKVIAMDKVKDITIESVMDEFTKTTEILNKKGINVLTMNKERLLKVDKVQLLIAYNQSEVEKAWEQLYYDYSSDLNGREYFAANQKPE